MTKPGYEHSETFASLKVSREEITVNLTTAQWLQTLDFFIESSLDPIATAWPEFLDAYFTKVVAWQVTRPSIKFSRGDKGMLPVHLFNSLTTSDRAKRKHQKKMLLNRGLLMGCVRKFLHTVNSYVRVQNLETTLRYETALSFTSHFERKAGNKHLYSAAMQAAYYEERASNFKRLITQKYVRLALTNAQRTYKLVEHRENLDDIVQVYLSCMSRAIDRCDLRQGVLTTFIQSWFHLARAEIQKKTSENTHASYEGLLESGLSLAYTEPDTSHEAIQHLAYIAKVADPIGVARYSLDIPEFFTNAELARLKTFLSPTTKEAHNGS